MGREIRRVPLDFDWPLNRVWDGYLLPDVVRPIHCTQCDGSGLNELTKQLSDRWYQHLCPPGVKAWYDELIQEEVDMLAESGRLYDFTHKWFPWWTEPMTREDACDYLGIDRHALRCRIWRGVSTKRDDDDSSKVVVLRRKGERGWVRRSDNYIPTAAEVNKWARHAFGHDSINHWICTEIRAKRLGIWGECETCHGKGHLFRNDIHKGNYEAWEPTDPPKGEGWQLWETVSEGSPISPVLATGEDLIDWLVQDGYSREAAINFVEGSGWVPSMVMVGGTIFKDVESSIL